MSVYLYFANFWVLVQGAMAGFVFGFLLQRGKLAKFNTIVNQLLLKDFTLFKVLLTAILVGSFGVYTMFFLDLISLGIGPTMLLGNIIGGLILGVGIAILGYCPGTCIAAFGSGSRDALWGILGMLVGGAIYAETYHLMKNALFKFGNLGSLTLSNVTRLHPFIILSLLSLAAIASFVALEKRKK